MKGRNPTPCTIPAISIALRTNISEPRITRINTDHNLKQKKKSDKPTCRVILVLLFSLCLIRVNPCDPWLRCLASALAFVVKNESFEFRFRTEVHQEPNFHISGAKIVHDLSLIGTLDCARSLDFDDNLIVHHDVGAE